MKRVNRVKVEVVGDDHRQGQVGWIDEYVFWLDGTFCAVVIFPDAIDTIRVKDLKPIL